jgi:hypothetical protein
MKNQVIEIKKLTKAETDEGLTLDLVNSKGVIQKASPVLLEKEGQPINLTKCSTGYWMRDHAGGYVKEAGKYKVLPPRDATIARARYLLYFGEQEKEAETQKLYENRLQKATDALQEYRAKIDKVIKRVSGENDFLTGILLLQCGDAAKKQYDAETERLKELLPEYEKEYTMVADNLTDGNVSFVLDFFDIEKRPEPGQPIVTAHYDNADEMRIVKNSFGANALNQHAGDVEKYIARLQIEQKY